MASDDEAIRQQIERSIDEAREGLSERIDQLDERLRKDFDLNKIASEHAVQLMGAGAAVGFVFGIGVPRAVLRLMQIGIPIGLAVVIAKKAQEMQEVDEAVPAAAVDDEQAG